MKTIYKIGASLIAALVLSQAASAISIDGSIAFDGSVSLDSPIPTATTFMSFTNAKVSSGTQTGHYVGTVGSAVTINPLAFDPYVAPANPFWSFSHLGVNYSFDFLTLVSVERASLGAGLFRLSVAGEGVAHITGFDSTPGAFSITTTGDGSATDLGFGAFTFVPIPTKEVPDAGATTMALLGLSLIGLGAFSRKLRKN